MPLDAPAQPNPRLNATKHRLSLLERSAQDADLRSARMRREDAEHDALLLKRQTERGTRMLGRDDLIRTDAELVASVDALFARRPA